MAELSQPKQNNSGVEAHGRVYYSSNNFLSFENMEENSVSLQDAFERFRLKRKVEVSIYLL